MRLAIALLAALSGAAIFLVFNLILNEYNQTIISFGK